MPNREILAVAQAGTDGLLEDRAMTLVGRTDDARRLGVISTPYGINAKSSLAES